MLTHTHTHTHTHMHSCIHIHSHLQTHMHGHTQMQKYLLIPYIRKNIQDLLFFKSGMTLMINCLLSCKINPCAKSRRKSSKIWADLEENKLIPSA